jgi:hypothetical protein
VLTQKEFLHTIASLEHLQIGCKIEGDIDAEYFDQLIQQIYLGERWLTPELAKKAKFSIDLIEKEIRITLRNLLKEGNNIPKLKKAKSAYNSFHSKRPIIGFERNA